MVRYKVKPDQAEKNAELVRAVYEELHRTEPSGMRYATFQLDDGVSFVHVHRSETDDGARALPELPAFKRFQEGIADRCEEQPVVSQITEVGSFGFFDD
jgi:quinol monooxygenase YgiN